MSYIIDFVDFIWNTITFIWSFFISLVTNTFRLIKYLTKAVEICYELVLELPGFVQPFVYITIIVTVLYVILGTSTGGKGE